MQTTYSILIRTLREQKGLSQEEMATKFGMSRSSWVALEKGTKELTLSEATALAGFFGITVDELTNSTMPDFEKYRQMILSYLRKAGEASLELKKTKLAKLLYFADFANYYSHTKSMSGMPYRKLEFGPVPDAYFRVLEELESEAQISIVQKATDDKKMYIISETRLSEMNPLNKLSQDEQSLIGQIWDKWKDANTNEIVQFTHGQIPYKNTVDGQIIAYGLIKQERPEYIY